MAFCLAPKIVQTDRRETLKKKIEIQFGQR